MRRSSSRRAATRRGPDRRLIAGAAVLVAIGGVIGFTQFANADETKVAACSAPAASQEPGGAKSATDPKVGDYVDKNGKLQHKGDGQLAKGEKAAEPEPVAECTEGATIKKTVNGLEILENTCENTKLAAHTGFQDGDRCVSTEFGEVGEAAKNPTLLITDFPEQVTVGQPFTLKVSTRNLVRDRFLAAGQGGYYVESSVLTAEGLVRGHFHTACRMLESTTEAVDPSPVPAFFVATEDGKGGANPDTVTIQVPGLPQEGTAQCASWAGDGSHRVPMMQRANETPAIDAVRLKVSAAAGGGNGDDQGNDGDDGDDQGNGGNNNGGGADNGGGNNGGGAEQPDPAESSAAPETETGTTPPKSPTVTIPPTTRPATGTDGQAESTTSPKPAKTTTAPATTKPTTKTPTSGNTSDDNDSADSGSNDSGSDDSSSGGSSGETEEETPAQNVQGNKTSTPKPSKSSAAAATGDSSDDDGAPDAVAPTAQHLEDEDIQASNENKLALTGANVMTAALGGAVLILAGFLVLSVTRRRRTGGR